MPAPVSMFFQIANNLETALFIVIAACGVVGLIMCLTTREDAFRAGDRQSRTVWALMLAGSAIGLWLHIPFVSWVGMVIIGLYWFDVRPQLKDIVSGNNSAW